MRLKIASFALTSLLLAGCANTTGMSPTTRQSGFDNARVVNITPHGNACSGMICTGLGAQWSEKTPDTALLMVAISNEITGITGAQLNIDGKVQTLKKTHTVTAFENHGGFKQSIQSFVVPTNLIREVTNSNRTWLRVQTPKGSYEDAVIDSGKDSKAFHALKRFLASVDTAGSSK